MRRGYKRRELDHVWGRLLVRWWKAEEIQRGELRPWFRKMTSVVHLRVQQENNHADKKHTKPLLLLDDIYDKLDAERFEKIISLVSGEDYGQVFITDTHLDRIKEQFKEQQTDYKIFMVSKGNIVNHG
jgi:DNA replication and repair protein RecF